MLATVGGKLRKRSTLVAIIIVSLFILLLSSAFINANKKPLSTSDSHAQKREVPLPIISLHRPTEVLPPGSKRNISSSRKSTTLPPHLMKKTTSGYIRPPVNVNSDVIQDVSMNSAVQENAVELALKIPNVISHEINCAKVIKGDKSEIAKGEAYQKKNPKVKIPDDAYSQLASNCDHFKKSRSYVTVPLSKEEEEFPIAYSIMLFKDVEQTERLLRAIYRPQNYYCIHVDIKSSPAIHKSMAAIADCFDNVFLSHRKVDVQWAWFSVLEPDLICMEDLWKYTKWRYFINLTGQEWPLKTNWDLVRILKTYNGANDMEGTVKRRNVDRTEYVHEGFWPTKERKRTPVPHGIRLTKGSVHIAVSREFVDFVLHNPIALDFKDWVKDTGVPDETFFTSLNHSPHIGVPGAYKGEPETDKDKKPFLARFKNWGTWPFDWPCAGQRVRMVCVFALGDLTLLASRPEMFTNKFYLDYQPLALDCMEELHYNRTRDEVLGVINFDTLYYQHLGFVKNHV